MASFSLVASAWKSTRVKVGFPSFRMASALVKGLSAPQARSQRPMRLMTRISAAPRSKSPTPRPGARPV